MGAAVDDLVAGGRSAAAIAAMDESRRLLTRPRRAIHRGVSTAGTSV